VGLFSDIPKNAPNRNGFTVLHPGIPAPGALHDPAVGRHKVHLEDRKGLTLEDLGEVPLATLPASWVEELEEGELLHLLVRISQDLFPGPIHVKEFALRIHVLDQVVGIVEEVPEPLFALLDHPFSLPAEVDFPGEGRVRFPCVLNDLLFPPEGYINAGEEPYEDTGVAHHLDGVSPNKNGVVVFGGKGHECAVGHHADQEANNEPMFESVYSPIPFVEIPESGRKKEEPGNDLSRLPNQMARLKGSPHGEKVENRKEYNGHQEGREVNGGFSYRRVIWLSEGPAPGYPTRKEEDGEEGPRGREAPGCQSLQLLGRPVPESSDGENGRKEIQKSGPDETGSDKEKSLLFLTVEPDQGEGTGYEGQEG